MVQSAARAKRGLILIDGLHSRPRRHACVNNLGSVGRAGDDKTQAKLRQKNNEHAFTTEAGGVRMLDGRGRDLLFSA